MLGTMCHWSAVGEHRDALTCIGRGRWIAALALLLSMVQTAPVGARETAGLGQLEWEQAAVMQPVNQLFSSTGGVLFASMEGAASRSTDGGTTWQTVPLPPAEEGTFDARPAALVAVDPRDAAVLYASGRGGLYKSTDGGSTWQLSTPLENGTRVVSVSAATTGLVYLGVTAGQSDLPLRMLRSRDGGATWQEVLRTGPATLCGWVFYLLQAHATDAQRVFNSFDCAAGRLFGSDVNQSRDQGATWSTWFHLVTNGISAGYPSRLVGGQGVAPTRFFLAVNRDFRLGGSTLFRTDDDGASWGEVLAFSGGGTFGEFDPDAPNTRIHGLAYDPATPDRVYVGLAMAVEEGGQRIERAGRVDASSDGGLTWQAVGQDIGPVRDLVLGVDTDRLLAATDSGVWRTHRVPQPPAPPVQLPAQKP